jgi:hypothetical protein
MSQPSVTVLSQSVSSFATFIPTMAPRKEHWSWKARDCPEVNGFDAALAMKEYVQNVVG